MVETEKGLRKESQDKSRVICFQFTTTAPASAAVKRTVSQRSQVSQVFCLTRLQSIHFFSQNRCPQGL